MNLSNFTHCMDACLLDGSLKNNEALAFNTKNNDLRHPNGSNQRQYLVCNGYILIFSQFFLFQVCCGCTILDHFSSNHSVSSGDERIETQGLVTAVATSRFSPTFRTGNGTNDTINGTMTVELADNCQISPKINGSGLIIKSQASINDDTVLTTVSSEERRDTAV